MATTTKPLPVFHSYMSLFQVQEKLKKGEVIEGVLRINPKNYEDAYISAPDGGMDIYIGGVRDRNAALQGDVVAVELLPSHQWKVLYEALDEYLESHPSQAQLLLQPQPQPPPPPQHYHTIITTTTNTPTTTPTNTTTTTTTASATTTTATATVTAATTTTTTTAAANVSRSTRPPKQTIAEKLSDSLTFPSRASSSDSDKPIPTIPGGELQQGDSDVLVEGAEEEEEEDEEEDGGGGGGRKGDLNSEAKRLKAAANKRRRRRGRGRKKGKSKDDTGGGGGEEEEEEEDLSPQVSSLQLSTKPPDQLILLPQQDFPSPSLPSLALEKREGVEEEEEEEEGSATLGMTVPPDELSECESTDDNSGVSEVLDYEQCREDQAFFQAQWQAYYGTQAPTGGEAQPGDSAMAKYTGGPGSARGGNNAKALCLDGSVQTPPSFSASEGLESSATVPQGQKSMSGTPTEAKRTPGASKHPARRKSKPGNNETPKGGEDMKSSSHPREQHFGVTVTPTGGRGGGAGRGGAPPQGRRGAHAHTTPNRQTQQRTEPTVQQVTRLDNWSKFVQRTGRVTHILDHKHPRLAAGYLRLFPDRNPSYALFAPTDHRVPRMKVPAAQLPPNFMTHHALLYQHKIFLCRIVQWCEPKFALGEVVKEVGQAGDIEAETEAILLEQGVEDQEFPPEALQDLPALPWSIPPQELSVRRDLRDECIFTIDPETALDLDDALSCVRLASGRLKLAVHIADVSHFVPEGSALDHVAARRATSVYMPHRVVAMLPRPLCNGLCSLLPGMDRLAMSVEWEVTPEGEVTSEWFGRTIIRSCAKLTYQQAQQVIDSGGGAEGLPAVHGPHTVEAVAQSVLVLHTLAQVLRRARFEGGALHLYQPKLSFTLDWTSGQPLGLAQASARDASHHLVEEFMLMANMAAANRTFLAFPGQCLLRRHPPPLTGPMEGVVRALAMAGVVLDASSAGALQAGMGQCRGAQALAVAALCSRPMQNARYFSPGGPAEEDTSGQHHHHHYALNVGRYTHFTSPIRRYPDLVVHRLLAATLDHPGPSPTLAGPPLDKVCDHCNDRKRAAKAVQEGTGELYLGLLVRRLGHLPQPALVVQVLDRSFDAVLLQLGLVRRVYTDQLPLSGLTYAKHQGRPSLALHWRAEAGRPPHTQWITLLARVDVELTPVDSNTLRFNTVLTRPQ